MINFLLELAKEIECETDVDLKTNYELFMRGSLFGGFVAIHHGYILVYIPRISESHVIDLKEPDSFDQLRKLLHGD